ncbi:MAG: ThiF family adenylyltransferase, partial [Candidatus Lokiarchaeota archaeon]
ITIFGIGGLGGSIAEQLVRSGCENIVICDNDKFETSNINRQLCTIHTIGKFKVDVLKNHLEEINPQANIKKYYEVNKFNIYSILKETKVATLTLDDPITSILVSRKCFKEKIPLIESFGFPYLCAWWFTPQSIDYESFYGLDTHNKPIELLRKEKDQISNIKMQISKFLLKFPGLRETYSREEGVLEKMYSGELPLVSIAPIIRLMASYITFEIIFTSILR